GRARAEPEPVEAEAAAQAVEDTGTASGERTGRRGKLEPLAGRDLADPTVEQDARQDLVLRHRGCRRQCDRRRRSKTADVDLCCDISGARLGNDFENRVELRAAIAG